MQAYVSIVNVYARTGISAVFGTELPGGDTELLRYPCPDLCLGMD
jgi:hypothetical protein